jgi:hypothetical protein
MRHLRKFPIHIINLKKRPDRLASIQCELSGRNEFDLVIVEAIEHPNGAMGLWQTIHSIVSSATDEELIIICEDDHQFTDAYSPEVLTSCIEEGIARDADILLGGISWFNEAAQISEHLFSVETFSATQFVVVFKKFYQNILDADFGDCDTADYKLAALTQKKFVIYPFISTQKEFGYSDATSRNNNFGRVTAIFNASFQRLTLLNEIWTFYCRKPIQQLSKFNDLPFESHQIIPTYILSSDLSNRHLESIQQQFGDKPEFDAIFVTPDDKDMGARGYFYCIQEVIKTAVRNGDDKIVICCSEHQFTPAYRTEYFRESIALAQKANAKFLSGGTDRFGSAVAVQKNLYWIDQFTNVQFVVFFKSSFDVILSLPKRSNLSLSMICNYISSNKLVIYPSISKRLEHENEQMSNDFILEHSKRINFLRDEFIKYSLEKNVTETNFQKA